MTTELSSSNPTYSSTNSTSTENNQPVPLPLFLTTSSSSLKPLRERNRTNLKRRIKLSRSQVLSNDFENDDTLSHVTNNIQKLTPSLVASIPTNTTIGGSSSQSTPLTRKSLIFVRSIPLSTNILILSFSKSCSQ